jgi:hypothetical protein
MSETHPPDHREDAAPPFRYAVTVLVALAVSTPAFLGALDDRLSLASALVRFLLALLACWAIGALFTFVTRVPGSAGADR